MLKSPLKAGRFTLKSRLVLPPMATGKAMNGLATDENVSYYDEMTRGGYLGLAVLEHCYVSKEGQASEHQLSIAEDACVSSLAKIAEISHKNGVPIIAQLNHAGSAAKQAITGLKPISATAMLNPRNKRLNVGEAEMPDGMSAEDIGRIIKCFAESARRAKEAGYDGVEIHSAHGYLLDQFYSPLSNKRTDEYTGATIEGRTRLHAEIIKAVRAVTGEDFFISLRLGATDSMEGGSDIADVPAAAQILTDAGIDLLSISGGMCAYFRPGFEGQGIFADLSEAAKKASDVPVLLTGGITEKEAAERLLSEGKADLIGVGRAFLKDHLLAEKWMK